MTLNNYSFASPAYFTRFGGKAENFFVIPEAFGGTYRGPLFIIIESPEKFQLEIQKISDDKKSFMTFTGVEHQFGAMSKEYKDFFDSQL